MKNQKTPPTQWISTLLLLMFGSLMLFLPSCKPKDPLPTVNKTSIVTPTSFGRTNQKLGCLDISGRNITISVWDNGTVDGDIVSVYVNGSRVIDEVTMGGPTDKTTVDVTLDYAGFNDIKLFAHNMGSVGENTAAMTIKDDAGTKSFSINSNLNTNGYFDVVVSGSGVSCGSGGGTTGGGTTGGGTTGGGTTGGGTTTTLGQVSFWTQSGDMIGIVNVTVNGVTRAVTIDNNSTPGCSNPGTANFTLNAGNYSFSASETSGTRTWGGTFTITANGCYNYRLLP